MRTPEIRTVWPEPEFRTFSLQHLIWAQDCLAHFQPKGIGQQEDFSNCIRAGVSCDVSVTWAVTTRQNSRHIRYGRSTGKSLFARISQLARQVQTKVIVLTKV